MPSCAEVHKSSALFLPVTKLPSVLNFLLCFYQNRYELTCVPYCLNEIDIREVVDRGVVQKLDEDRDYKTTSHVKSHVPTSVENYDRTFLLERPSLRRRVCKQTR